MATTETTDMHWTSRWRKDGRVQTRCRQAVRHREATTHDWEVTCDRCLAGMARDDAKAGRHPRTFKPPATQPGELITEAELNSRLADSYKPRVIADNRPPRP